MAKGYYYTRQELNQLNQQRASSRAAAAAKAKYERENRYYNPTTQKFQETKPQNPYVAQMEAFRKAATEAQAWKRQGGSGYYQGKKLGTYNRTNDDLAIVRKADAWDRAATQKTSFAQEKAYFDDRLAASNKRQRERQEFTAAARDAGMTQAEYRRVLNKGGQEAALIAKFGGEIYAAMSPEARKTAYSQLTNNNFVPTPNTAAYKDYNNRRQEVLMDTLKSREARIQEREEEAVLSSQTQSYLRTTTYAQGGMSPLAPYSAATYYKRATL